MFEDRTTEQIKKEALAEINPATGLSSMAGSFADSVIGPAARRVSELYTLAPSEKWSTSRISLTSSTN